MKKIKVKLWHIVIGSILVGIIISTLVGIFNQQFVASFKKDYPSEKEYSTLKEYATMYANKMDSSFMADDTISISHTFENDFLIVTVENFKCKIEAEYPLKTEMVGDGTFVTKISFDEANYKETSHVKSIPHTIFNLILICAAYTCLSTVVVLEICEVFNIIEKKKQKPQKQESI